MDNPSPTGSWKGGFPPSPGPKVAALAGRWRLATAVAHEGLKGPKGPEGRGGSRGCVVKVWLDSSVPSDLMGFNGD